MEHEGSLPHSQVPATCPYPEPLNFLKIYLNIILLSAPWSPKWSLFLRYLLRIRICTFLFLHYMPRALPILLPFKEKQINKSKKHDFIKTNKLIVNIIFIKFCFWRLLIISLYFITQKMFSEDYKSWRGPLCSLLQSPVTSGFLLGSYIPPSTLFSHTLSLCAFLSEITHFWHPHKTTDKIIGLCISLHFSIVSWKLNDSGRNFLNWICS